jgi:hypothetical protein
MQLLRTTDHILHTEVRNLGDESLGRIEDLVIDAETGAIRYAVLSAGDFLGIGDKLFAVPWISLRPDPSRKVFLLDAHKDRLERAPGFDKDHWPNMEDDQWGEQVHRAYGPPLGER